ncbi:MAG: tRNA (adenosine(37)-N6)-threonylcarbamoyltransferase complex ATPase subunit type 1 TsaE [Deltaproteobacteria bacterium]|nr:tRNA (adenosine(37)-N6)-threonylcarbamoyltransferase complex ATPase subunit type 1 TsaE [Deltaproteobacteria bacterium]
MCWAMIHLLNEGATLAAGEALASLLRPGSWIALEGPLGAGKTTLARGVARGLGLAEDVPVTSPTFALVQEYDTTPRFVHGDLYRLSHACELEPLGLLERLDEGAIVALEWALPFVAELGRPELVLRLSHDDAGGRGLQVEGAAAERARSKLRAAVAEGEAL